MTEIPLDNQDKYVDVFDKGRRRYTFFKKHWGGLPGLFLLYTALFIDTETLFDHEHETIDFLNGAEK